MTDSERAREAMEQAWVALETQKSFTVNMRAFPVDLLAEQIAAALAAVRAETVEACAKVCDERATFYGGDVNDENDWPTQRARADACEELAAALRALTEKEPTT